MCQTILMLESECWKPFATALIGWLCCFFLQVYQVLDQCTCPVRFPVLRVAEGKYRMGESKSLIFVRVRKSRWLMSQLQAKLYFLWVREGVGPQSQQKETLESMRTGIIFAKLTRLYFHHCLSTVQLNCDDHLHLHVILCSQLTKFLFDPILWFADSCAL